MDDDQPLNARDAADEAGRPLQPPKRNAAEQKREIDAALRLVHGTSGDFDDVGDADEQPDDSDDGSPDTSDERAEDSTGDVLGGDESAAAPDSADDLSGSSYPFSSPIADSVSSISWAGNWPDESGGVTLADDFVSIPAFGDGAGSAERGDGEDAVVDDGDSVNESIARPNELIKITIVPAEAADEGPLADSPEERSGKPTDGTRPARRTNYLPIPLDQQGGEGTSTPRVYLDVTVQGAELIAGEAIERVATRIDRLIDERIEAKIDQWEWHHACQMRAVLGR